MQEIIVKLGERSYPIYIGKEMLGNLVAKLSSLGKRGAIITDTNVNQLWGKELELCLGAGDYSLPVYTIAAGEVSKSIAVAEKGYRQLLKWGLDRKSFLIAFGGGVVGDLSGFIAATYMRGITCVQVPTTLMAQVDSSIGGKTGVNLCEGKNLVGSFWQPKFVFSDVETLKTLPQNEMKTGLAEVIKYGVIKDKELFHYLEDNTDKIHSTDINWEDIISRCASIKADIVSRDELELIGLRAILNYGHTIGHALETLTEYQGLSHGEAVAIGMVAAARLSYRLGHLSETDKERQIRVIEQIGLPIAIPEIKDKQATINKILQMLRYDKKAVAGKLKFVLAKSIGEVMVTDKVTEKDVQAVLEEMV